MLYSQPNVLKIDTNIIKIFNALDVIALDL